ncbi:MAG: hypothetical protein HXY51_09980 [Nitrospirae bacterium]|nr:hypothetical protein [Nitrospirota bacterium]
MKHTTLLATLGTSFCVLAALSCSGGGGGGTGVPSASTTPVTSTGTVTDFGSVYVNDRKYEINDSTTTTKDDSTVSGDQNAKSVLRRGMVVTVSGTSSGTTRTASTIIHQNTLEGPIQIKNPIDASNGTLTVLGQTVVVDNTTQFDDTSTPNKLDSLSLNDVIEVSGFVKEDTTGVFIMASFIEKKLGATVCSSICEVKGKITSHTPLQSSFQISTLIVNYTTADITDMPNPNSVNWVGLLVEVKGSNYNAGTLTATKVEREGFQAPNGDQVELEGYVTSLIGGAGSGQFMIGTTTVQATNALYLGGTIAEVAVGQKLEVEGSISNNIITATKVKFQDSVRLEGIVSSITGSTMTLGGMPTITITSNSATEVQSNTPVAVGDRVKVRGREGATANGTVNVIATEVDGNGPDNCNPCDVDLQGAVQVVSNPNLTILGVQINTSTSGSDFSDPADFKGTSDQAIGRAAFFGAVTIGTVVEVKGRLTNGAITWREVELEE